MKKMTRILEAVQRTAIIVIVMVIAIGFFACDDGGGGYEDEPGGMTRDDAIMLSVDTWADGRIPAVNGEQWFKFTATADTQYVHAVGGSIGSVSVQLNDDKGAPIGDSASLSATYIERTLIVGGVYYIRVVPSSTLSGTYKIAFSASAVPPGETFPPANPIALTENTWANGSIAANGVQWFSFTATAATQYIHFNPGTLASLRIHVYTSTGEPVGGLTALSSTSRSANRTLEVGDVYYIRAHYFSGGTYQIAFNDGVFPPGDDFPPSNAVELSFDTWTDSSITAHGVQWFSFTATADTQYIHFAPGTLWNVLVQMYDSEGAAVGTQTTLSTGSWSYSRTVTNEGVYYIRIIPGTISGTGTYRLAYNESTLSPGEFQAGTQTATTLTTDTWEDGSILTHAGAQWFKFTATADTQYIHFAPGSLGSVRAQVYDSTGAAVSGQSTLNTGTESMSRTVTNGEMYYIRILPGTTSVTGTYRLAYNESTFFLGGFQSVTQTASTLTADTWENGNILTPGDEWFKFTATAATQYIHFAPGSVLNDIYMQVYNADGGLVGSRANLWGSSLSASCTLTVDQEYYIRVWPYYFDRLGEYHIAFNDSYTPPSGP